MLVDEDTTTLGKLCFNQFEPKDLKVPHLIGFQFLPFPPNMTVLNILLESTAVESNPANLLGPSLLFAITDMHAH